MFRFTLLVVLVAVIGSHASVIRRIQLRQLGRIYNGVDAASGEFPSQLSLQYLGSHNCGASILNANWALTAAHCVDGFYESELSLLAGTTDLGSGGSVHQVEQIIAHKQYDASDSWRNDIAVIKVSTPFALDSSRQPIKLPAQDQDTATDSVATVIGWGYTENSDLPNKLQKVDIFISDQDRCNAVYQEDYDTNVYDTQICADVPEGNKGSCNGDSGGPLFVNGEVVGLVSWAAGCADKGYPTVYTRVASYRSWITQQTGV